MRKLTYINPNGDSIELFDPLYGITKLEGLGIPNVEIQEKKAPFQDGSTPIDVLFEPREVVVEGIIALDGEANIYQARRDLISTINLKYGPGQLIYSNDDANWMLQAVTPEGPIFNNRSRREGSQKWQTTFYSYDPYWHDVNAIESTLSGTGLLSLTNNGDVECPVEIILQGPITNPEIINNTTGEYIRIVKTFTASDFAIIYTGYGEKVIYIGTGEIPALSFPVSGLGIDAKGIAFSTLEQYNGMGYLDLNSQFIQLAVGANELELIDEGTNSGMSMTVSYRQRYAGN